jgi:hypothetical protein
MSAKNPEEPSEPKSKKQQSDDNERKAKQHISATPGEPDMPPPNAERDKSPKTEKHRLDYCTFGVEILGLAGLAIYACLTYGIYKQSRVQSGDARDAITQSARQFTEEQRPYVSQTINSTSGPKWIENPLHKDQGQILWNWHMTNYGKTPAQEIRFTQEINLNGNGWKESHEETGPNTGPPMVQGQEVFDTVISDLIQKKDFDKLMGTTDGLAIRIKISYVGLDGSSYETGLSLSRTNSGSITYRKQDNYVR